MNRIAQLRKERRWSMNYLAQQLSVDRSTISYWESGKRIPSNDMQQDLSDLFNVDIDYLMGRS